MQVSDQRALPDRTECVSVLRFTTDHLLPSERYKAWLMRDWPRRSPTYHTIPNEPFNTKWESVQLGDVMFVYTEITGATWERRQRDIRLSDFDPIVINMMIDGIAHGDMDGRSFYESASMLHFHDLARPSLHVSTASKTYSIVISRPLAQQMFGHLQDLHGLVVPVAPAAMLFALAEFTYGTLTNLSIDVAQRLGRVFLELAAIALDQVRPLAQPYLTPKMRLFQRAVEEIDSRLANGKIKNSILCDVLETTPSQLSAAFRAEGGVQNFIMRRRIIRARTALGELERLEPIGNIAHRLGFYDSSHLVRIFREHFGMSPREYRTFIQSYPDRAEPV